MIARIHPVLIALALALPSPAGAGDGFFDRNAEGWFWYHDPAAETDPPPETSVLPADPKGPAPFSAEWLRDQLPIWQLRAMDDPTGPAMKIHMLLERIAIAKADQYKDARMALTWSDPLLDATSGIYTSTGGLRMARTHAEEVQSDILRELSQTTGLWFFYESTCPYCARQAFALRQLAAEYGFEIMAIAIDGRPLPTWPDRFVQDVGQAELLGVTRWPALYLVRPPDSYAHLSTGLATFPELQRRIVAVAYQNGWISEAQWLRSKASGERTPRVQGATLRDIHHEDMSDEQMLDLLQQAIVAGTEE